MRGVTLGERGVGVGRDGGLRRRGEKCLPVMRQ